MFCTVEAARMAETPARVPGVVLTCPAWEVEQVGSKAGDMVRTEIDIGNHNLQRQST